MNNRMKEVPKPGENENRFHAQRFLKKAFKLLDLDEKHELDPETFIAASIANSLIYVGDGIKRNNEILSLDEVA